MSEFKFYIDIPDGDVKIEERDGKRRIYFRSRGVVGAVLKLMEDLKIYAKYHNR